MHIVHNNTKPHSAYEQDYLTWYERTNDSTGTPFDPRSLLQQAREQWKPVPAMAEAFARCTREWSRNELYSYFLAPTERKNWKFAGNVPLAHPEWGTLLVDIMHHPTVPGVYAIAGIEYLDRVMGRQVTVGDVLQWMGIVDDARDGGSALKMNTR